MLRIFLVLSIRNKLNSYLNISNIMRLKKLDFKDVYSITDMDIYLLRESVLERFMIIITSYFCMGTELRFLRQLKVQGFKESIEAQFWHGRALEMAISLFPGDSPLVKHIIQSYKKHHAPSAEIIPEDYSISHEVKVVKPMIGVHSNKEYPMIQNCDYIYDDIEDVKEIEKKENSEFEIKKNENKSHCMIRITSLDMPKNDYMKYVRKVIYELNLKDEKEVIDEFPQDPKGPVKADKEIFNSDGINTNSVLEINNILDSDGKNEDEPTPKHKNAFEMKKFSKGNEVFQYSEEGKRTAEASTQISQVRSHKEDKRIEKKDFGVSVLPKINNYIKPQTSSIGCSTTITMNTKDLSSIISTNSEESKPKSKRHQNHKSHLEEFQDIDFIKNHSELNRHYNKNRGKRHKSSEKSKK